MTQNTLFKKSLLLSTTCGFIALVPFALPIINAANYHDHNHHEKRNHEMDTKGYKHDKQVTKFIKSYSSIVYDTYLATLHDAKKMQKKIEAFLENPSISTLSNAKQAWLNARESYNATEVFRFYEGPIDFVNSNTGEEGPEGQLNAWPLNESYIDYVAENMNSGIIQNLSVPINKETLLSKNLELNEDTVSVGYHAIEFLLWGQDLSLISPGNRPLSDYMISNLNSNKENKIIERRKQYLDVTTQILIDDLNFLVDSWKPNTNNYRVKFAKKSQDEILLDIFVSLATLSGFELSAERIATALDSRDQEDEHSCFSDNTHNDYIDNIYGILNVYSGTDANPFGLQHIIASKNPELAEKIQKQILNSLNLALALPSPIDAKVIMASEDSKGRIIAEKLIDSLNIQTQLLIDAGKLFGLDVKIHH